MKKILITGGSGFIGSHLCKILLAQGNQIYCLDNLSCGNKDNIATLLGHPRFSFIEHDVKDKIFINVDEIYNLACPASPKQYQINPVDTVLTCVLGAVNMLNLAQQCNAKILQTSTSEIYGDPLVTPQVETYLGNVNPIGPRSCYNEGKRCAEGLFMNYYHSNNTQIRIARIFNTFGPNLAVNDGRVVSNFIVQSLSGQDITIYGTGQQTRSFCYVDDTVRGLLALMSSTVTGPVNIGNPTEFSILEMATKIIHLTKSSSKLVFLSGQFDDPKQRCPDISLAKNTLNWSPQVSIDVGLQNTIDYFKRKLKCL